MNKLLFAVVMWCRWSAVTTAFSYMPGSFRPIPVDAAGELKGYFSDKAVTELEDLDAMMRNVRKQQRNPSSSLFSNYQPNNRNMEYSDDYFRPITTRSSPRIQEFQPHGEQQDLMMQQQHHEEMHRASLEERVKQLELQLAQLLKYGIPDTSPSNPQELPAAATTTSAAPPQMNPAAAATATNTATSSATVKTFQGIPYSSATPPQPTIENTPRNTISDTTATTTTPMNPWDKLRSELERCQHMKGGEQLLSSSSSSSSHQHTVNAMESWPAILQEAHAEEDKVDEPFSSLDSSGDDNTSEDSMTFITIMDPRQLRLRQEMERCQFMNRGEIKQELEHRGIDTRSLLEKSEFVRLLAHARIQEEEEDAAVEVKEAELVTDDSEPRSHSHNGVYVQDEVGGSGMPTGGFSAQYGGVGSVVGCNGDGIPDMAKYGDGGGAHGGANPFVMAKVRECLANPAAFAKYYSDPDLVGIIRELRQQMA
eukprot:scaffold2021_cov176-Amphora_coffeaeformis.AAC.13